jgi:hypothetical protein
MVSRVAHIYDGLFMLADLPGPSELRQEAVKVLQLLPTSQAIPHALRQALCHHQLDGLQHVTCDNGTSASHDTELQAMLLKLLTLSPGQEGSGMQFEEDDQHQVRPARLLYTLQALHSLLFPLPNPLDVLEQGDDQNVRVSNAARAVDSSEETQKRLGSEETETASAAATASEAVHVNVLSTPPLSQQQTPLISDIAYVCIPPLLTRVLDWVQQQQQQQNNSLDATFIRELYAVSTHLVANISLGFLEQTQQQQTQQQQQQQQRQQRRQRVQSLPTESVLQVDR